MELCALAGTLLGDSDGIYDPAQYNDRLLLGLKGTMSEAEIHLIKQRMAAGRPAKAQRGELFFSVPADHPGDVVQGLMRQIDGGTLIEKHLKLLVTTVWIVGSTPLPGASCRYRPNHGIAIL
ncbi:hypothetical protein AB0C28_42925 [Nonomuraea sp. NPDC048892]|uniref:hypothetical protein n=1 Tax=Nonomuraea sp. NPDC048892 TaxID=3154624 RepID=UPI000A491F9A